MTMTVRTQGGAVYSIEYRDFDDTGRRLGVLRHGGPDDPSGTNKPMREDTWYRVNVLSPLPPEIGTQLRMILDPMEDDPDPVVRQTTMVMSVVGMLD
ncbi:hypothetical protein [Amnibacterium endophyticum]|uniref:Uncharacterized protein n=1 Tax=Amnibacterium endophyticum TaxID=2109337 RepID=A0ABW4LAX2_9MICO